MIGELFAGFIGGNKYASNVEKLKSFMNNEGVSILNVTTETSEIFGEL